jgi:peptidoglycan/LPS O-acetylase OafA/YrhL
MHKSDSRISTWLLAIGSTVFAAIITSIPLASRFRKKSASSTVSKPSPTAWLDGMRGYASFFVSLYHLRNGFTDSVHVGWGQGGGNHLIYDLPFIRIIFSGPAMVAIFFLVSGYSLSWGSFKDLQVGKVEKCLDRIRSSVFRRFLRLYLPTIASSFVVLVCICLGLYERGSRMDARTKYREPMPKIFPSTSEQIWDWYLNTVEFLNLWGASENRHLYYPHSWSIPEEFKCSIMLYVGMIGIAKLRVIPRVAALLFCIAYCHWTGFYHLWSFFVGAALAQLNVYRLVEHGWVDGFPPASSRRKTILKIIVFVFGMFLLSYPDWSGI